MPYTYFKEFTFTRPVFSMNEYLSHQPISVTHIPPGSDEPILLKFELVDSEIVSVSPDSRSDFSPTIHYDVSLYLSNLLTKVNDSIDHSFNSDLVSIHLISRDELTPVTSKKRKRLVENYGEYILDNIGGNCELCEDGTFLLNIGFESGVSLDALHRYVAHEYGHTLGRRINDQVFEEMKAYSFQSLFERIEKGFASSFYEDTYNLRSDRVHDVARHRVGELLRAEIPEESILSHLIDEPVGDYTQKSYLDFL